MEAIIKITACCKTDPGLRRSRNEDACLVDIEGGFFLVADGIGGAAAGEIASALFVESTADIFATHPHQSAEETREAVQQSFLAANRRILADIAATPAHSGMGCTAELLAVHNHGFVLGHVGDSRTYRLRQGVLSQLTLDHSLVQQQLDQGLVSLEQVRNHPMKNIILRAVGIDRQLAVDIIQGPLLPRDLFLLCSDGLSDMVRDSQIEHVLALGEPLPRKAAMLVDLANAAGGRDNVSTVLIEVQ